MSDFRQRLLAGEGIIGTWVKTPSSIVCEVLALTDLDVICLDAEHAPFGRLELDQCLAISMAKGMSCLVRVPNMEASTILNALDCGATGIVAPHICTKESAEAFAKMCKFGGANGGTRGYAGSTRAAAFTTSPLSKNLEINQTETVTIAQIEDIEALECLDDIASVDGIDCLFVGRIDLTVALGAPSPMDDRVVDAVKKICAVGKKHGKIVGMFTPSTDEIPMWRDVGASVFILGSEQSFILSGAQAMKDNFSRKWEE
ncbi:aldolase/citrate lyase family protein [Temperatibacter marinus]|uniref:Aldolase/citrate lyase family protein n=1 Tax=Temperatibacter marinus TaxID=1456591 RepID=A0AA52EI90_9PROT|nr:aldolase/citrate lyase family protein [Temperatibacter marinus]WND03027.1 aldolase/citrate lyase family protein [Temperatibacter marinus]